MDTQIGIWRIEDNKPIRLQRSRLALEKYLEDWIEANPEMIQQGIVIVGRQVHCDGGYIDLLAVDQYSNSWVIIEVKRGNVRRETVAQAIDYAASIDMMPASKLQEKVDDYLTQHGSSLSQLTDDNIIQDDMFGENRDIKLAVVGTGRDADLSRMTSYLADKPNMNIAVVEFDVFEGNQGEISIVRQLSEQDEQKRQTETIQQTEDEYERLFSVAQSNGIGQEFRMVYDACTRNGLYARPYKWSIMFTPPQHRGRCLVVVWARPTYGKLKSYAIPETFAEYFPVSEEQTLDIVGDGDRKLLTLSETQSFVNQIDNLFQLIASNSIE